MKGRGGHSKGSDEWGGGGGGPVFSPSPVSVSFICLIKGTGRAVGAILVNWRTLPWREESQFGHKGFPHPTSPPPPSTSVLSAHAYPLTHPLRVKVLIGPKIRRSWNKCILIVLSKSWSRVIKRGSHVRLYFTNVNCVKFFNWMLFLCVEVSYVMLTFHWIKHLNLHIEFPQFTTICARTINGCLLFA